MSGQDPGFPTSGTDGILDHLDGNEDYEIVEDGNYESGDIAVRGARYENGERIPGHVKIRGSDDNWYDAGCAG